MGPQQRLDSYYFIDHVLTLQSVRGAPVTTRRVAGEKWMTGSSIQSGLNSGMSLSQLLYFSLVTAGYIHHANAVTQQTTRHCTKQRLGSP